MDTFNQVSDYVDAYTRDLIDVNFPAPSPARRQAVIDAGKALIILGVAYVGNALGCEDPQQPLALAKQLLAQLAELGKVLKNQN